MTHALFQFSLWTIGAIVALMFGDLLNAALAALAAAAWYTAI